jgi:hypothetical protein
VDRACKAGQARCATPRLKIVDSPYRRLYEPILEVMKDVREEEPDRVIAVVIPKLVERAGFRCTREQWPIREAEASRQAGRLGPTTGHAGFAEI